MNSGDIILVRGNNRNLLDLGIMHSSHSSLSHVAIAVDENSIVEALVPKVHHIANPYIDPSKFVVMSPPYTSEQARDAAVATALGYVGDGYDVIGVGEMLLFELSSGLNRDAVVAVLRRWSKLPVMWCSELVANCLIAAGLPFPVKSFITTPGDVGNYLGFREPESLPDGLTVMEWQKLTSPSFKLISPRE